jgi:hypothetical protein
MNKLVVAALLAVALAAAGCNINNGRGGSARVVDQADHVELWANPPVAINWDQDPAPDGVRVSVLLYQTSAAAPVLIKGTLEFLMFDGRIPDGSLASAKPLQTWSFTEQELATRQVATMVGWGYDVQLGWGRNVPAASAVTVIVRYKSPKGPVISSAPTIIAVGR